MIVSEQLKGCHSEVAFVAEGEIIIDVHQTVGTQQVPWIGSSNIEKSRCCQGMVENVIGPLILPTDGAN